MPDAVAVLEETDLEHVSFLAAGQEHEQVPEIVLAVETGPPEPRGALSYMFARASREWRISTATASCAATSCGGSCARTSAP